MPVIDQATSSTIVSVFTQHSQRMMARAFCFLWLCACATPGKAPPSAAPAQPTTPGKVVSQPPAGTTPADATQPSATRSLEVELRSSKQAIAPGESVELAIVATNYGQTSVWTQPGITCTGSWDIVFRSPEGATVRVDDRDAMGCPSGGVLNKEVTAGQSITFSVSWDGLARPSVGQRVNAPGGMYEIEASVRWSDKAGTPNFRGPKTVVTKARATLEVLGPKGAALPPVQSTATQPSPTPTPPPVTTTGMSLRQLFRQFTPPTQILVPVGQGRVSVSRSTYKASRAAISGTKDRAKRAELRAVFLQQNGVSMAAVAQEIGRLRRSYEQLVIAGIAHSLGIRNPRLKSWGAAAGSLGIAGTIKGKPVLWHGGKIYRDGQRPRNSRNKCLPPSARIATPRGEIALGQLAVGDSVWSLDRHGNKVAVLIGEKSQVPVVAAHSMVKLTLADGRVVQVSPMHPSATMGVTMGGLSVGDALDGSIVLHRRTVAYQDKATQDILPLGDTHLYWANGILMGSTLAP